jgi:hypothetical protein
LSFSLINTLSISKMLNQLCLDMHVSKCVLVCR